MREELGDTAGLAAALKRKGSALFLGTSSPYLVAAPVLNRAYQCSACSTDARVADAVAHRALPRA
eukprot:3938302-Rhodomonas_salina.1